MLLSKVFLIVFTLCLGWQLRAFLYRENIGKLSLLLPASLFLQFAVMGERALQIGRCPLGSMGEAVFFASWIIAVASFSLERVDHDRPPHALILPIAWVMALSGWGMSLNELGLPPHLSSPLFPLHVSLLMASYALFICSFVLSLLHYHTLSGLKKHELGFFHARLPSLKTQELHSSSLIFVGCLLAPSGLAFGIAWSVQAEVHNSLITIKFLLGILSWLCFYIQYYLRRRSGILYRRDLILSALGIVLILVNLLVGRHGF